jgi:predicted lipid-binding transport protein (Tim44 family)
MKIFRRKAILITFGVFAVLGLSQIILETYADARAGGGRSGGFRGSRSYSSPARPAQPSSPAEPRREAMAPAAQANPMAQSGGFMRTFGMAMLGGFLGSMLFSGLAHAGLGGFGGSGFGMIEIVLLAALGFFLYRKFRTPAAATNYGSMQYRSSQHEAPANAGYRAASSASLSEAPSHDQIDYRSVTMMDPGFAPDQFLRTAQDIFFKVQGAWNKQDGAALKALCGAELMRTWEAELASLRDRGQQNKMENIALRQSEITEAWTENGEDYITVRLHAHMLDYTVDTKSGAVVSGSDSQPIEFEEYWTFARPVGPNAWKLSAVQQA